jgi:hypothetical protein
MSKRFNLNFKQGSHARLDYLIRGVRQRTVFVYGVYVKWLDKIQEWVPHRNKGKKYVTGVCLQATIFRGTFPTFPLTSFLAVLICGSLKNLSVFSHIWQWRDTSPFIFDACRTFRNLSETFERARPCVVWYVRVCIDWGGGYFEHLLWNFFLYTTLTHQLLDWVRVP